MSDTGMMDFQLLHGDCLELMKDIPNGSVDMVLADLPYHTTAHKWDKLLPLELLWDEFKRALKPNGVCVIFASEPFATKLRVSNMEQYKYDWIWVKSNATGFQHAKNMPLKNHELILVFSGGSIGHKALISSDKRMPYYPQGIRKVNRICKTTNHKWNIPGSRPSHKNEFIQEFECYPKTTLRFNKETGKALHPAQKPVALLEYLIRTYTNKGEVVLDNCMGSGSAGVACANSGRKFIGIEIDDGYFKLGKKRIELAYQQRRKIVKTATEEDEYERTEKFIYGQMEMREYGGKV